MTTTREIENQTIAGMEIMPLKKAIEKSIQEGFSLLYQSTVPKEAYGTLKYFSTSEKEGYCFIPVFIEGEFVVLQKEQPFTKH